jgi:hypothetical protein
MARLFYLAIISLFVSFLMGCPKEVVPHSTTSSLEGVWVKENDMPGRQPADTLFFIKKSGRDVLAFYSAGSPGPNWPSQAEQNINLKMISSALKTIRVQAMIS